MIYPQPVVNNLLIRVNSERVDKIKHGNLELQVAGAEHGEDVSVYAQREGYVVNIPRGMSKGYNFGRIVPEVKKGDKVFLHYSAIDEDSSVDVGDEVLYVVPYDYIFAVIRNDTQIVVIGGRVLCLPIHNEDVIDEGGIKVRKTSTGIIKEINVRHDLTRAVLSHIGTPSKDRKPLPAKPGDTIFYAKDADFKNTVEGVDYFCMTQEDILLYEPKRNK